jgi:hypothetical protein
VKATIKKTVTATLALIATVISASAAEMLTTTKAGPDALVEYAPPYNEWIVTYGLGQ